MNLSRKTLLAALLAAMAATPAFADKGGGGHGRGHGRHGGDRVVLLATGHPYACPPGLAKKNPPCVPPGQARNAARVVIGQPLPPGAVFVVPRPVLATLPPPPFGYRYAVINNQVVLVSDANIVVDIVIRSLFG